MRKLILTYAALLLSTAAMAQDSFLFLSGSSESIALGGSAAAAYRTNYMAASENISLSALSDDCMSFGADYISYQPNYLSSQIYQGGGYIRATEKITVGATYRYEMLPEQSIVNGSGEIDGSMRAYGMGTELGVGYALNEKISVGASLSYIFTDIYTLSDSAFGVDLNATYRNEEITAVILISGLGTQGKSSIEQPTSIELASSNILEFAPRHELSYMGSFGYIVAPKGITSFTCGMGVEYSFDKRYFARVGYRDFNKKYAPGYSSFGVGVRISQFKVDATYIAAKSNSPINSSFMVGLTWTKKRKINN